VAQFPASNDPTVPILCDDADLRWLLQFTWWVGKDGYARAKDGDRFVLMHRVVAGVTDGRLHVDHVNRRRSDNRRSNLRLTTPAENFANKKASSRSASGVKGVYACRRTGLWVADITSHGKRVAVGRYATVEEARAARDSKAAEMQGQYAWLNAPLEQGPPPTDLTRKKNSAYRGVHYCRTWRRWKAGVRDGDKAIRLGTFHTEEEAGRAVLAWVKTNKPERLAEKRYSSLLTLDAPAE
jgi:hypothetical protein